MSESSSPASLLRHSSAGVIWMWILEQQLPGVPGHVNHCGLLPFDGVVVLPCMLRYCRLLQGPCPTGLLVFSQPGLQPSSNLTNVALAITAGDSVHHLGLLLYW